MYQVYLLSVLTLLLASFSLGYDELDERLNISSVFGRDLFTRPGFRFGLGTVTALVGLFQFLAVHPGQIVILGNFIPAAAGIALGGTLLLMFYKERSTVESAFVERLDRIFLKNAAPIAYLGIVIALLHFLFHGVLFL